MIPIPRLRHVAELTATRLTCAPIAVKGWSTSNSLAGDLFQIRRAFVRTLTSLPPGVTRRQNENGRSPSGNTRSISIEAPREPTAGSEPGIDISDEDAWPQWRQRVQSQITAVDFSAERIEKYELTNATLGDFLAKPREDWVTCRWINGEKLSANHS